MYGVGSRVSTLTYRATDFLHRRPQGSWFYEGDNYCDAGGTYESAINSASVFSADQLFCCGNDCVNDLLIVRGAQICPLTD